MMDEIERTRNFFNKEKRNGRNSDSPVQQFVYRVTCACIPRMDSATHALDVGCNGGRYTTYLARHFARVWGIDHAELSLKTADQAPNIEYLCLDVERDGLRLCELLPRMDLVIAIGLFEMLRYPANLASSLYGVIRPGGQVFLMIPNRASFNYVVLRTMMWIGRKFLGKNWFIYNNGITPELLKTYVKDAGFEIRREGMIVGIPVYLLDRLPYPAQSLLIRMDSLFKAVCGGGYYWISGVRTA
jgi:2-polyprenyl-3-methyl-5-hydroxy-6-metoxy-1,4-benzoquinol methylase